MKKNQMKKITLTIALLFAVCAYATNSNPQYRSLRVQGMGNAFVAVADNKDALYYNPAGLNLINRLGNFEKNPDMGYMPQSKGSFRLFAFVNELPFGEANDVLGVCGNRTEFWDAFFFEFDKFGKIKWCKELIDQLEEGGSELEELALKLAKFDRKSLIKMSMQINLMEFAMHNFGFSIWANTSSAMSPYIDMSVVLPAIGYDSLTVDFAAQTAIAFSPIENWSFGIGLKAVQRHSQPGSIVYPNYDPQNPFSTSAYQDSLKNILDSLENISDVFKPSNFADIGKYNFALDFGALYQIHREIRLGTSLRDVYFSKLDGESITPNLSFGAMASPMILQSNSWWERKVIFAIDYVDVLNENLSDMPLSHLNFGTEIEQNIIPSPTRDMSFLPQLGFGILGGVLGGGIGYLVGRSFKGPEVGPLFLGSLIGIGSGVIIGRSYGAGNDLLRASVGGGFSGGYWSATGALKISFLGIRFSSWAEEMGLRTGQKENRHYMLELGSAF